MLSYCDILNRSEDCKVI